MACLPLVQVTTSMAVKRVEKQIREETIQRRRRAMLLGLPQSAITASAGGGGGGGDDTIMLSPVGRGSAIAADGRPAQSLRSDGGGGGGGGFTPTSPRQRPSKEPGGRGGTTPSHLPLLGPPVVTSPVRNLAEEVRRFAVRLCLVIFSGIFVKVCV
jgi:hypothetical protein